MRCPIDTSPLEENSSAAAPTPPASTPFHAYPSAFCAWERECTFTDNRYKDGARKSGGGETGGTCPHEYCA